MQYSTIMCIHCSHASDALNVVRTLVFDALNFLKSLKSAYIDIKTVNINSNEMQVVRKLTIFVNIIKCAHFLRCALVSIDDRDEWTPENPVARFTLLFVCPHALQVFVLKCSSSIQSREFTTNLGPLARTSPFGFGIDSKLFQYW